MKNHHPVSKWRGALRTPSDVDAYLKEVRGHDGGGGYERSAERSGTGLEAVSEADEFTNVAVRMTGKASIIMSITGTVHKFGDHVDTDVIIPARYLTTTDPVELAAHCMEDIDGAFIGRVQPGDVMVAGRNFGCGSSREHAPISIKAAGVSVVIAASFARIFYRNALNIGLPIIECPEAAEAIAAGDQVEVDLEGGTIRDLTTGRDFTFAPLVGAAQDLIAAGGLVQLTRQKLARA